jgi:hypothetical protein
VLYPSCVTTSQSSPTIGKETNIASLTLTTVCTALSYSLTLAKNRIREAGKQYGNLSSLQFVIVGIIEKKGGVSLKLYVTAIVEPVVHTRFGNIGK